MKRYGVEYCDEGGTLFDSDDKPIPHTWDVIDRATRDPEGHPRTISNHYTRRAARQEAAELNAAEEAKRHEQHR